MSVFSSVAGFFRRIFGFGNDDVVSPGEEIAVVQPRRREEPSEAAAEEEQQQQSAPPPEPADVPGIEPLEVSRRREKDALAGDAWEEDHSGDVTIGPDDYVRAAERRLQRTFSRYQGEYGPYVSDASESLVWGEDGLEDEEEKGSQMSFDFASPDGEKGGRSR